MIDSDDNLYPGHLSLHEFLVVIIMFKIVAIILIIITISFVVQQLICSQCQLTIIADKQKIEFL